VPNRAVIFDIGGVLGVVPEGGDPSAAFPRLYAAWDAPLGLPAGTFHERMMAQGERLFRAGKDGRLGTRTEEEWHTGLREATGMSASQLEAFLRAFWDVYCGALNAELTAYFAALRPRYRTALLSNSWIGARREEHARFHFADLTDLIVYSHEEGIAKPDPRILALTCERLSVRPGETIFLDDAPSNIAAAQACGLHAILFGDTAQAIADIEARLQEA
jgi:putative hydrolase of the HAD superfamily